MHIQQEIERRNKLFQDKTLMEKRVLIAEDVIVQVNAGNIVGGGSYVDNAEVSEDLQLEDRNIRDLLLEHFATKKSQCQCCGIGALMISCTLFNNNEKGLSDWARHFESGNGIKWGNVQNGLHEIFTPYELHDIEDHFEGWRGDKYFAETYPDRTERLVAIMELIIQNKGELNWPEPSDEYDNE